MASASRTAVALLALFVTFFVVLAFDIAWRLWTSRAGFPSPADLTLLLALEAVRAMVTFSAVCLAVVASRRREPGHTAFAFALLFFALWYVKFVAYAGYPGHLQQWMATGLIGMGVPKPLLQLLFGQPAWALALAMAAFFVFATRYPQPPRAEFVRAVHATGRRGMLRDVALAGTDVRSLVHRAAARVLSSKLVDPKPVTLLGLAAATALALGGRGWMVSAFILIVPAFACALAFLRTAHLIVDGPHRPRLRNLGWAGISISLEMVAVGMLAFLPGGGLARVALAMAAAAPLGALYFLIRFVRADADAALSPPAISAGNGTIPSLAA